MPEYLAPAFGAVCKALQKHRPAICLSNPACNTPHFVQEKLLAAVSVDEQVEANCVPEVGSFEAASHVSNLPPKDLVIS